MSKRTLIQQAAVAMLSEESLATTSFLITHSALQESIVSARSIYPLTKVTAAILQEATMKLDRVAERRKRQYDGTVSSMHSLMGQPRTD